MDNLESKKLNNENLVNVAGGTQSENDDIISFLRGRGYLGEYTDRKKELAKVNDLLKNAGVTAIISDKNNNQYAIWRSRADHKEVMEHLDRMFPQK